MKKPSAQIKPGNSYRFIQDKRCFFTAVVLLWYFLSAFVSPYRSVPAKLWLGDKTMRVNAMCRRPIRVLRPSRVAGLNHLA